MKTGLCVALIVYFMISSAHASSYTYVNYSAPPNFDGGKVVFTLDIGSMMVTSSDVTGGITLCGRDDPRYCFSGSWITFSVPKSGIKKGLLWKYNGVKFDVLRSDTIVILGQVRKVWIINSVPNNHLRNTLVFYYSENDGLLAIKDLGSGTGKSQIQFFIVTGDRGFPQ